MSFSTKAFSPADGLRNAAVYPTTPTSETEARKQVQGRLDECRDMVNGLQTELEEVTTGASGAENIGSAAISGVSGTTVRAQIIDLKNQVDTISAGGFSDGVINSATYFGSSVVPGTAIQNDAINSEHYVDGSIDTAHLSDDCVTGAKIADNSIDSEHYVLESIDAVHLSSDCVEEAKIKESAVTTTKIADGAVTAAKLASDAFIWSEIGTKWNIGSTAGSSAVTSLKAYKELMFQIRDNGDDDAAVKGMAIAPIRPDGLLRPKYIYVPISYNSGQSVYFRKFWTGSDVSIYWGATPDTGEQRLYLYAR